MIFQVTYFSSCLEDGPLRQTNKCSGLKVGTQVTFTAKIEVVKCPKDPREWTQTFQIYPVGINESVIVNLEMLCQCNCEKPGNQETSDVQSVLNTIFWNREIDNCLYNILSYFIKSFSLCLVSILPFSFPDSFFCSFKSISHK